MYMRIMFMHSKLLFVTGLIWVCTFMNPILGQDTIRILTEEQFLAIVKTNHPIAKQSDLLVKQANAQLLEARGLFDPFFMFDNQRKTFDGKTYFNYSNGELSVPTWYGVSLYTGIENNTGDFINTELTRNKSSYAGVSIPLLKDLVLDKRRAVLQQSKLFLRQSRSERRNLLNDLFLEAYQAYWNWARNYETYLILGNTIRVNEFRYELVKQSFEQGDRAAIDTSEALAQLLQFQQQREEAWLNYKKSSFELSVFLWSQNQPVYLTERVIPDTIWSKQTFQQVLLPPINEWISNVAQHPKLQMLDFKQQSMEVERKLKFQSMLPKVNLKYNFLQSGYDPLKGVGLNFMDNNYKFGLNVAVPVPNRNGIGQYRSAKIKVQSIQLDRSYMQSTIENKIFYYYNEVSNLRKQIEIVEQARKQYQALFDAEFLKFGLGETTLFLMNMRENKLLEVDRKLIELKAKYLQSIASLNWAAGRLN